MSPMPMSHATHMIESRHRTGDVTQQAALAAETI